MLGDLLDVGIAFVAIMFVLTMIVRSVVDVIKKWMDVKGKELSGSLEALLGSQATPLLESLRTSVGGGPVRVHDLSKAELLQAIDYFFPKQEVQEARRKVEMLYDLTMDRFKRFYKRKMKFFSFGVAAAVVLVLNMDAIRIFRALQADATLREAMTTSAERWAPPPTASPQETVTPEQWRQAYKASKDQIQDFLVSDVALGLGIGFWNFDFTKANWIGFLLSLFLLTVAAPIWHDLLDRMVGFKLKPKGRDES